MLDRHLRPLIDPPLNALGRRLANRGVSANGVTAAGMLLGVSAAVCIAQGSFALALAFILASRLADGLDGAVARAGTPSDWGGYADIVADFVFYAAIPLGFIWLDPAANGLAGGLLLGAFYVNAASFLGFAILAEKHALSTSANGAKSWYHATGLLEGTETIVFFVVLCLWPSGFVPLALGFALLCLFTAGARLMHARTLFR